MKNPPLDERVEIQPGVLCHLNWRHWADWADCSERVMKGFFERPCQPVNEVKYAGNLIRSWCPSLPNHLRKGGLCQSDSLLHLSVHLSCVCLLNLLICLRLWKCSVCVCVCVCVRVRVCILHLSGCVFGVIASELQACQWPFLIYSCIKKLLPALAFLFYVCSSLHEEAPWLPSAMLFFLIFLYVEGSLCSVCGGVHVRGRSVVSVCAF